MITPSPALILLALQGSSYFPFLKISSLPTTSISLSWRWKTEKLGPQVNSPLKSSMTVCGVSINLFPFFRKHWLLPHPTSVLLSFRTRQCSFPTETFLTPFMISIGLHRYSTGLKWASYIFPLPSISHLPQPYKLFWVVKNKTKSKPGCMEAMGSSKMFFEILKGIGCAVFNP